MNLLITANGEPFATGVAPFRYHAPLNDLSNRIILQVEIEGFLVDAIVDTGSPYVVCPPYLAEAMGLQPGNALERIPFLIRGHRMVGGLHRLNVHFIAATGDSLVVDATVFVPDADENEVWGDHPAYIGLTGCLERMRFAIDLEHNLFYFGVPQPI